jgi:membrane associated rhomboid family serine protease
MIPLGDDNSDRKTKPFVTWAFIAVNVLVFVLLQGFGTNPRFTYSWSTVPAEILSGRDLVTPDRMVSDPSTGGRAVLPGLGPTPLSVYLTLLTSMFMHGGIAHLLGNMLYLLIFGDNIEDRLGRVKYILFYLLCGVSASLAHVFATKLTGGRLDVPSLGASGAISGVLGAYLMLFPRRRVRVLVFRFIANVPAFVVVGLWFVFQVVNGLGMLGGRTGGGVAYAAHVGGFVVGFLTIRLWAAGRRRPA